MKKFGKILGLFLVVLVIFGCASTPSKETIIPPPVREPGVEYTLALLHTNDHFRL